MCANWVGDNRDMSPDRNRTNGYQFDNVGLQIGLGLPLQLLGVSLMTDFNGPRHNGNRGRGGYRRNHSRQNPNPKVEIQRTCDGIPIRTLYVPTICTEVSYQEFRELFVRHGEVHQIFLGVSKNYPYKQFAFVTYVDPLNAARVLSMQRVYSKREWWVNVVPADSWHQPRELPDGQVDWRTRGKNPARKEEENEEEVSTEEPLCQVETEINEGSLNSLNDDCLLHIFSFLSLKEIIAIERVCKRWQALSLRVWRTLHELHFRADGPLGKKPCTTRMLEEYLKRCGASLTKLDLIAKEHKFNASTLAVVAKYCENLEVLRVGDIAVAKRSLAHIGRSCKKLKQLIMKGTEEVSDADLNCLLPRLADLSLLDLANIEGLSGKCLANVEGPVTSLRLSGLDKMESEHFIKAIQKKSPTLDTITLNAWDHIPRNILQEMVSAVPNLTSLSLTRCMMQFDSEGLALIGQLKKLTTLDLRFNNAVNDAVLTAIVEGCEELTALNLCGSAGGYVKVVSERGLSQLACIRTLRHLNISYLEATNNTALKSFTARNCRLKSLLCRGCPDLNDEGTQPVVTLCNELEVFDVSGCRGVTDKTVETALTSIKIRTNNTKLRLVVGGTQAHPMPGDVAKEAPLLTVDLTDFCEDTLRPDFIDGMFLPASDSEDDDLDHLCCDCDFDFDDLFDPTLVMDETRSFGFDYDEDDIYEGCPDVEYDFDGWRIGFL